MDRGGGGEESFSRWKALLVLEWIALLIGAVMPITPSKTGGKVSLSSALFGEPSYWREALIWFLITNVMLALFLGMAWFVTWWERVRGSQ